MLKYILFVLSLPSTLWACNNTLRAYILDISDNKPLEYATIYYGSNIILSDSVGYFEINKLCNDTIHIHISHLNCPDTICDIPVFNDTLLYLYMDHEDNNLDEVLIVANYTKSGYLDNYMYLSVVEQNNIANYNTNINSYLKKIPTITLTNSGGNISKPTINGLFGDRLLLVHNNAPLISQDWGTEHAPELSSSNISNIKYINNAECAKYNANAYSGIIFISSNKDINTYHYHQSLSYNTNNGWIEANQQWSNNINFNNNRDTLLYNVGASYYIAKDNKAPDYNILNTATRMGSANVSIKYVKQLHTHTLTHTLHYNYFNNTNGIMRNAHTGNIDDLQRIIANNKPIYFDENNYKIEHPKQEVQHHNLYLSHDNNFKKIRYTISYNFQTDNRKEYDIRRGNRSSIPALAMNLFAHNIETLVSVPLKNATISSGIATQYVVNNNQEDLGIKPLVPNYTKSNSALWVLAELPINDNHNILLSGRYQWDRYAIFTFDTINNNIQNNHNFHPIGLYATYNLAISHFSIQNTVSYHIKAPNIAELYSQGLHHAAAAIEYGNKDLSTEKIFKESMHVFYHPIKYRSTGLKFHTNLMYMMAHNFIYLKPRTIPIQTIRGAYYAYDYHQDDIHLFNYIQDVELSFLHNTYQILLNVSSG